MNRYVRSVQGQENVKLLFTLRTGSAGRIRKDVDGERCVISDSRVREDVVLISLCIVGDRLMLFDDVCRIV